MKFLSYINESQRTKDIKIEEAVELLKTKCPKNFHDTTNSIRILRGTIGDSLYRIGDSTKGKPRKSANTLNYYTLLMDNSKYWKDYPKRSRSFICSTYEDNFYGDTLYVVVPYDGTTIGICPADDLWRSFKMVSGQMNLAYINDALTSIFHLYNPKTWQELKSQLDSKDITKDDIPSGYEYGIKQTFIQKWLDGDRQGKKKFSEYMEYYYQPKLNNFNFTKNYSDLKKGKEVWFSGNAVFVREDVWVNVMLKAKYGKV